MEWGIEVGGIVQGQFDLVHPGVSSSHYIPVLPKRLLNLLDIGELMENTGVDEPRDVD